jgi:P27 family predicted phage terminase small subunit
MGRRGPIAKSHRLKVLQGTWRRDRNASIGIEPPAEVLVPRIPSWLSLEGREEWKLRAKDLAAQGLLNKLFVPTFSILCEELALWKKINRELQEKGATYLTKRGLPRIHPLVNAERKVWANCLALLKDFGLTPVSGQRLGVRTEPPRKPNKWDEYFNNAS